MQATSVRDRIRAAELARQQAEGDSSSPNSSRLGPKFALKSNEHVKEEVLKRGDGGWTKNMNIGQTTPFAIPKAIPAIQVTKVKTSVVDKKKQLPGRITVPGAFEANELEEEKVAPLPKAGVLTSNARKGSVKTGPKSPKTTDPALKPKAKPTKAPLGFQRASTSSTKLAPIIVTAESNERARSQSRGQGPTSATSPADNKSVLPKAFKGTVRVRAKPVLTKPPDSKTRKKVNHNQKPPSPTTKRKERTNLLDLDEDSQQDHLTTPLQPHPRSNHSEQSTDNELVDGPSQTHQRPSIQPHKHSSDSHLNISQTPRRSSSSFWPSFSPSKRRSPSIQPKPADDSSILDKPLPSPSPSKEISFMEYASGKKLDTTYPPDTSPKLKPSERLGYVRSRSSKGGYSEHFTRDKRLLRRPSDDEVLEYYSDHSRERRRDAATKKRGDEPWGVKLARGLVI